MSDYKHTPGPWSVVHHISYCDDYPMNRSTYVNIENILIHIGACGGDIHNEKIEANARLIAAAPELLRTLEIVLKIIDDNYWENYDEHDVFRVENDDLLDNAKAFVAQLKKVESIK